MDTYTPKLYGMYSSNSMCVCVCVVLQRGQVVAELLEESWDEDPKARLTAANILYRLELLQDMKSVPQTSPLDLSREEHKRVDGQPVVRRTYHHPLRYSVGTEMMPPVSQIESFAVNHDCGQCQPVIQQPPNNSLVDSATVQPYTSFGEDSLVTPPLSTLTHTSSSGSIEQKLEEVKPTLTPPEVESTPSQSSSHITWESWPRQSHQRVTASSAHDEKCQFRTIGDIFLFIHVSSEEINFYWELFPFHYPCVIVYACRESTRSH